MTTTLRIYRARNYDNIRRLRTRRLRFASGLPHLAVTSGFVLSGKAYSTTTVDNSRQHTRFATLATSYRFNFVLMLRLLLISLFDFIIYLIFL
jgi:hypothetical protein